MPVEIKELVVRAQISPAQSPPPTKTGPADDANLEDLVTRCVARVLRILEQRHEP